MAFSFLKRDFPDVPPDMIKLRQSRRLAFILFIATHGLWVLVCAIALAVSLNDAYPHGRESLVARLDLDLR